MNTCMPLTIGKNLLKMHKQWKRSEQPGRVLWRHNLSDDVMAKPDKNWHSWRKCYFCLHCRKKMAQNICFVHTWCRTWWWIMHTSSCHTLKDDILSNQFFHICSLSQTKKKNSCKWILRRAITKTNMFHSIPLFCKTQHALIMCHRFSIHFVKHNMH